MKTLFASLVLTAAGLIAGALPAAAEPRLNIPAGVTIQITDSGCGSTHQGPYCPFGADVRSNWYSTYYRLIVLATNQRPATQMHEYCHAHQHEAVIYYLGREPSLDIREWYQTQEFAIWSWHVGASPSPYELSAPTSLEDWATACGLYFTDPGSLWSLSPERYHAIAGVFGYW